MALEAILGLKTTNEIAAEFGVHTTQIRHWKKQDVESLLELFANHWGQSREEDAALKDRLFQHIIKTIPICFGTSGHVFQGFLAAGVFQGIEL